MTDPDNRLSLTVQEILHAEQYVQLVSVEPYIHRDGEILLRPYFVAKKEDKGVIIRATFFVTQEKESKFVTVLYRVFGGGNRKEDFPKLFTEIKRQAHDLYYRRRKTGKFPEARALSKVQLEPEDWLS